MAPGKDTPDPARGLPATAALAQKLVSSAAQQAQLVHDMAARATELAAKEDQATSMHAQALVAARY